MSQRYSRTSIAHPLKIATVTVGEKGGRIGITFCPGKKGPSVFGAHRDRDLTVDVRAIRDWGASSVLTLIEPHEFDLLSVKRLPDAVGDAGMVWHHAPIPDGSVPGPAFEAAWRTIGSSISEQLRTGGAVVLHCRGGLGRAGMIAAMLMVMLDEDPRQAIERVRSIRPGAIETTDQLNYVVEWSNQR
ncbi:cyclin-dependent kinase inhibitor 3 family protein [Methylobacterium sp. C1]|uniref:cyclin-dependent kinase inhibitor 3 family protein n=1 Tax=Methylobacterium sp. C1 TaxID=1479019 RepID=UPI0008DAC305|nr:cyclin-dependent kinase inhibitor 3 family protein [Methylobacterium sp. C1]